MSNISWRVSVQMNDRSARTISTSSTGVGGTVVASPRSVEKPILFARGETQRILNLFGTPTNAKQGLLEAIEYNKNYPLWMVSPAKLLKRAYVTIGMGAEPSSDYALSDVSNGGFVAGKDFEFSASAGVLKEVYVSNSNLNEETPDVKINGNFDSFNVDLTQETFSDETTGISGRVDKDEEESGETRDEYIVTADTTFQEGRTYYILLDGGYVIADVTPGDPVPSTPTYYEKITVPVMITLGYKISLTNIPDAYNAGLYVSYNKSFLNDANIYGFLFQRGCGKVDYTLNIKPVAYGTERVGEEDLTKYYLTLTIQGKTNTGNIATFSTVNFAFDPDAIDGFDNSLNFERAFENNDYFQAVYNNSTEIFARITEDFSKTIAVEGFERDLGLEGVDLEKGYACFHSINKYPVDLFFDATGDPSVIGYLKTIRGGDSGTGETLGYQPYARCLLPLNGTTAAQLKQEVVMAGRGFSFYAGKMKVRNAYSNRYSVLECVPMGDIAKRHADAIVISYGGLAVAWIDENGVGGQLTSGRIMGLASSQEEWSETELRELDEARINPVVYDDIYGPMVVSRRTAVSEYSDYSFNDYSGIMDYCLKNIIKYVLPYQIVKLNDAEHRAVVKARCESILRPLTAVPYNVLDSFAVKCDAENNSPEVLAMEEFRLDVAIKVTAKSRTIHLTFTNTPQTSTVEEMFE